MVEIKSKKRKVSKKTKKSWRKHVDIADIDNFLESERLEERLGVPFSERLDADLFTVDKCNNVKKITQATKKERRRDSQKKEPKCFSSLKPHTQIADPITKRNRVRTPEERRHPILLQREAERKSKGILKLKEKVALKNKTIAKLKRSKIPKRGQFEKDVWEKEDIILSEVNTEWMTSDTVRHVISHMGTKKRKLPISLKRKPSNLPAIEIPHPGTSYNPSYQDHQKLLHEIAQQELNLIKEEAHLNRVTTKMFEKVSNDKKQQNILKELSEGLPLNTTNKSKSFNTNNISNESDNSEDAPTEVKFANPPVKNKKKTLVARRKQKEQKLLAYKNALTKLERKKVSDIYKLKFLQKHIENKERKEIILQERKLAKKKLKSIEPKTLSKVKFEPPDPAFILAEELSGNLKNIRHTTNLLKERYTSLQQRNIVAPTTIVLKQSRAKVKKYIKPDHKIDNIKM